MFEGQIVLDYTGEPVRAFDIPWTISSAVEGCRIEAWKRANKRMKLTDIVARIYTKVEDGMKKPLGNQRYLATREKRFRQQEGLVAWEKQKAKREAVAYFDSLRSDAQKKHNLAVQRELTEAERATYEWITINRDLDRGDLTDTAQRRRENRMHQFQRRAGEAYPEGEFLPGARDVDDLFEGSVEISSDRPGGEAGVLASSSMSRVASSRVPTPDLGDMLVPGGCEIPHVATPTVMTYDTLGGEEATLSRDSFPVAESTQGFAPIDSGAEHFWERQASGFFNPPSPSISSDSELEDAADSRRTEPAIVEDAEMLQSALVWTIADYLELSGGSILKQTNLVENYLSQWAALQTQFHVVWRELWNNDSAPTLRGLDRWTGGISNWPTAALARSERDLADEEAAARYLGEAEAIHSDNGHSWKK